MQDILNSIDSIPEISLDIKDNVIKSIVSFDASEMSVTDLRGYIEYVKQELQKNITKDQNDCYDKLLIRLSIEKEDRPFHEQFPEVSTNIDKILKETSLLLETTKIHSSQIMTFQNVNNKKDLQLEQFVNNAVSKYFMNGIVLVSGYKYKTEQGNAAELDGVIIGKDENGMDAIVFVETKSDMNSGWKIAQTQMLRTLAHWRFLKEIVSDKDTNILQTYANDIDILNVKEFKDYKIRCAFGANDFSQETVKKFNSFNKYHWLRIVKLKDDGFQVIRHS